MFRLMSFVVVATASFFVAQPNPVSPDFNTPRPIDAVDTVFLEDMTWMEVRDAMRAGTDTILIATGGVEQNGPYLVAGKHNVVLKATTAAIAKKLGNTLVAPIVPFVPEGDIQPPTVHMKYPSTISVTEETYAALITDIAASFKTHGFKRIVLIGDSGGNQTGLKSVANKLNKLWAGGKTSIHYIPEYYDYGAVGKFLEDHGIKQTPEGLHDDFAITAMMMTVDPSSVRMDQRIAAGKFSINGINLAPVEKTISWGNKLIEFRATQTVAAIRKSFQK